MRHVINTQGELIVSGIESFPGELDVLRADNTRLRRLLKLSEEQARAAANDQATLTGAPASPVTMESRSAEKVRFFFDLFRCRTDIYAVRWENRRDGRSGWMPAIKGYWRKGMNRADAPYLPLTPEVIDAHLRGEAHIGLYPLSDDDTCWWVAADFDKEAAMLDALAYMKAARSNEIPAALEVSQSGRGSDAQREDLHETRFDTGQNGFFVVGLTGTAGATASYLGGRFGSQHLVPRP